MQDTQDGYDVTACHPVDHDMPCGLDKPCRCPGSMSAVAQVIDAPTGTEIIALHRPNPLPVLSDVAERGCDECFIAAAGRWPKVISAPIEQFSNVPFGRSRESETRHDLCFRRLLAGDSKACEELG